MLDTNARKHVQKGFNSLAKGTGLYKLSPNSITVVAFIVGISSAVALALGETYIALVLLWISGALDVLDGTVARLTGKSSSIGAYLDIVFDRLVEGATIIGFFVFRPEFSLYYMLFFVGVLFNFTTFMLAGTLFKNNGKKSMHYDIGIVERTETFIAFSLMMLLPEYIYISLSVFTSLMFVTGIIRMHKIISHSKQN